MDLFYKTIFRGILAFVITVAFFYGFAWLGNQECAFTVPGWNGVDEGLPLPLVMKGFFIVVACVSTVCIFVTVFYVFTYVYEKVYSALLGSNSYNSEENSDMNNSNDR